MHGHAHLGPCPSYHEDEHPQCFCQQLPDGAATNRERLLNLLQHFALWLQPAATGAPVVTAHFIALS